jgi:hypothetical protein
VLPEDLLEINPSVTPQPPRVQRCRIALPSVLPLHYKCANHTMEGET